VAIVLAACGRSTPPASGTSSPQQPRPSILLVTLDTTRADAIGPEARGIDTPSFNAVAARGRRFRQAYAAVPETLPAHTSLMTGLYPAGHGIHENARSLPPSVPVLAERLHQAGYRTMAFVSAFVLAKQFGLARGFDVFDDTFPAGRSERTAVETTDAALAELGAAASGQPRFLWVHYYDPHYPYTPPEPFRTKYRTAPYLGEVAAMDQQLGRLVQAFEQHAAGPVAIVLVADHGEGLGDHGEAQHGTLVYQATMHVPLVIAGPGVATGTTDTPVSTRRVFHTILDWAGLGSEHSLRDPANEAQEVVLGEAMKPFLEYGWQPQIMAVDGRYKGIEAGKLESYDVITDPAETHNLGAGANLPQRMRKGLDDYPVPSPDAARTPDTLDADARARLASLGYIGAGAAPVVRKDAPRPADMTALLPAIERASGLFTAGRYAAAIPLLEEIRAKDPYNLDATLRLAVAHSSLGHDATAVELFRKTMAIAPKSPDVPVYLGLHYARTKDWARALPLLEQAHAQDPNRLPVLEALADIRQRQGHLPDAIALRQQIYTLRAPTGAELVDLGHLAMDAGQTQTAIDAFERARSVRGKAFSHDLELGVLYLDARRYVDAKQALDRVPSSDRDYPMALFKRAQVAVLLHEPDAPARIALAKKRADAVTRPLIAREKLFVK